MALSGAQPEGTGPAGLRTGCDRRKSLWDTLHVEYTALGAPRPESC